MPYLVYRWLAWAAGRRVPAEPPWALWGLLGVVLAFTLLRNLPGLAVLTS